MGASSDSATTERKRDQRILPRLRALVRARLTAGFITVLPLIITIWLIKILFEIMRDASLWVVVALLRSEWGAQFLHNWGVTSADVAAQGLKALPSTVQWTISILCVFLTVFLLYFIGLFTANIIGRHTLTTVERIVDRVPLIKTIYRSSKQVLGVLGGDDTQRFQSVALIPFPNQTTRFVAFVTSRFRDSLTGEELLTTFMPLAPPTAGFLVILKREDVIEVDWSVEDAIKMVMSGGILHPEFVTLASKADAEAALSRRPIVA